MDEPIEPTRGSLPREQSGGRFAAPDGLRDLVKRLLDWLRSRAGSDLEAVSTATTMRNVVDTDALDDRTPPKWDVQHDMVTYGSDTLTDVLVFRHGPTRQELVVMPGGTPIRKERSASITPTATEAPATCCRSARTRSPRRSATSSNALTGSSSCSPGEASNSERLHRLLRL